MGVPARNVLVVDDQRDAADQLAILLRVLGCEVKAAYDGKTALAVAKTFKPEVVFVDLVLPGTDGFEIARQLRKQNGNAMKIVALTGFGGQQVIDGATAAGFDAHILKPASAEDLKPFLAN